MTPKDRLVKEIWDYIYDNWIEVTNEGYIFAPTDDDGIAEFRKGLEIIITKALKAQEE